MVRISTFLDRFSHAAAPVFGAFSHESGTEISTARSPFDFSGIRRAGDEMRDLRAFTEMVHAEEHKFHSQDVVIMQLRKAPEMTLGSSLSASGSSQKVAISATNASDRNDSGTVGRLRPQSIGALLILAIIWGGSIPATKLGLTDFPPLTLTALRYIVAAPFFGFLLLGRSLPPLRALLAMTGLGILGVGVGQICQVFGVERTSASVATVISAIIPILVVVLAAFRLRQPIRLRHAIGLASAFAGVGLVAAGGPHYLLHGLANGTLEGDALMLGSALTIAAYYGLSIELVARYSAVTVAGWTSLAGALAMVPLLGWELRSSPMKPTVLGIAVVLYLALLVTVVGVWIWLRALERLPVRVAAALQYLQPLFGVTASAAIFGDPLGIWFGVGTGLVFIGIGLSTTPTRCSRVATRPTIITLARQRHPCKREHQ